MIPPGPKARSQGAAVLILLLILFWNPADALRETVNARRNSVGMVFFSSRNCPLCKDVKELVKGLKVTYPIRVKTFDIERKKDYLLFKRMESIHGRGNFSVPLIMLGDAILIGEDEIAAKLEMTVQELAVSGGAPFPYLGPGRTANRAPRRGKPQSRTVDTTKHQSKKSVEKGCRECAKKGRPPSLGEEWNRIKSLIDKYF